MGEESVFAGVHLGVAGVGFVGVTGEVEYAVDDVEGEFGACGCKCGAAFCGVALGDIGTDDDLGIDAVGGVIGAEVEGEDIGGSGDAGVLLVERGHGAGTDDGDGKHAGIEAFGLAGVAGDAFEESECLPGIARSPGDFDGEGVVGHVAC